MSSLDDAAAGSTVARAFLVVIMSVLGIMLLIAFVVAPSASAAGGCGGG